MSNILSFLRAAPVLALSALLTGCIGDDEAIIFVEPTVSSPQATITGSVLGSTINGSFKLRLVLGPRASGSSTVTLDATSIFDAAGRTDVVPSLSLTPSQSFPLTVAPSSDMEIDVAFDIDDQTLDMVTTDRLCAAAGVTIFGRINDSLQTGATNFRSDTFSPMGCP
jgi:hypothetical protein